MVLLGKGGAAKRAHINGPRQTGAVVEWHGEFGFAQTAKRVPHPHASPDGRIHFAVEDVMEELDGLGHDVNFTVFSDGRKLCAADVRNGSATPLVKVPAAVFGNSAKGSKKGKFSAQVRPSLSSEPPEDFEDAGEGHAAAAAWYKGSLLGSRKGKGKGHAQVPPCSPEPSEDFEDAGEGPVALPHQTAANLLNPNNKHYDPQLAHRLGLVKNVNVALSSPTLTRADLLNPNNPNYNPELASSVGHVTHVNDVGNKVVGMGSLKTQKRSQQRKGTPQVPPAIAQTAWDKSKKTSNTSTTPLEAIEAVAAAGEGHQWGVELNMWDAAKNGNVRCYCCAGCETKLLVTVHLSGQGKKKKERTYTIEGQEVCPGA